MSPEQLEKAMKPAEASSTTPPYRRTSESGDRKSKRRDSPRGSRRDDRQRSRSNRDQSRSRKDSRRSRNESLNNGALFPNVSINQNKVNRDYPFPKTVGIELFKTLQGFSSMADCNRALVNECSKVSAKNEIAGN